MRIVGSPKRGEPLLSSQESRQTPLLRSYSTKLIQVQPPVSVHTAPTAYPSYPQGRSYYLPSFPAVQQVAPSLMQSSGYLPSLAAALPQPQQPAYHSHPKSYEPIRISTITESRPMAAASMVARQSRDSEMSVSLSTAQYSVQRLTPLRTEVRSEALTVGPGETPRSVQQAPAASAAGGRQALLDSQKRLVLLAMENGRLAAKGQDYETALVEMRARINTLEVQLHDHERLAVEFGRLKERSESLEVRMQESLEERAQFLAEIEQLQAASKRSRTADGDSEQLREQVRRLEEENEALGRRFTLLMTENARLQSITHENEELRAQVFALSQDRDRLAAEQAERRGSLDSVGRELAQARAAAEEVSSLRSKVAMLVSENELLQGLRPEVASLTERLARLGADHDALQTVRRENTELRAAVAKPQELQRTAVHAGNEPGSSESQGEARLEAPPSERKELDVLRAQVGELQTENENLRQELSASRVEFEQIVLDFDRKLQAAAHGGADLEPLKRSVGALTHERDELQRNLVQAQNDFNLLEARNKMLQTELENERKTLAVLHQRCELYEKDSQELRARLQEAQAPLSSSGQFERPTQTAAGELQAQLEELGEENSQLKAEITDLDELLLSKDHDIEEVTKYSKYLEGELGEVRRLLVEKDTEIGKLVDEVKLLQQRTGSSRSPDTDNLASSK